MTAHEPLSVLVLAGGISHERDVSLRSGRRVADALRAAGVQASLRDPDATLLDFLRDTPPAVVWPVLHGASGEDGALLGLLELAGVPYVGSSARSARLAWDKPTAKAIAESAGIRTPRSVTLPKDTFRELGAAAVLRLVTEAVPAPYAVKPARGGSAQGVTIVTDAEALPRAMVDAYTYGDVALIEQLVEGTEVAIGVLDTGDGPEALPATEIVPTSGVYGYEARYNAGLTRFFTPARISPEANAAASAAAIGIHRALGIGQMSRVDIIIDAAGEPWFIEVNVIPGLTETSLLPQGLAAAGVEVGDLYRRLAEAARGASSGP
ncbi:D-alanine--D-alanine ligase family protein [Clavibacter michiganensis]|uniref:D-alanine--D-alanine ligase family protein n=1 Tax=Clavibacter michiganensis TaxID=28447 RepID=UPI000CE835DA|nr:D-alanine--D-alanine ligase [Clavibacter michiganensis]MBE3077707.1 D-alanine--D-alanine ligase [Clavibacter michiganensis subsp. michiganensis]MDO4029808.1 D-alanine--D-alanine ligase [Clavibacter michiganensis]PPF85989.1 D-alanine--D-alanine ligase [Clavibacter michiganensis]PPF99968.1 D-alanine--D-alanine ligase [Clavibacter michiganensis]QIT12775.1 D-alanine--D-alanine ligase [Clavibacter michiganensis subsp. michiganensis]